VIDRYAIVKRAAACRAGVVPGLTEPRWFLLGPAREWPVNAKRNIRASILTIHSCLGFSVWRGTEESWRPLNTGWGCWRCYRRSSAFIGG